VMWKCKKAYKHVILHVILSVITFVFVFAPVWVFAKSYQYKHIDVTLKVNPDAAVDVREELTFDFNGEFHKGWRSIALKGLDRITDIKVFDENGKPFEYSYRKLDKTYPASWGKYTTYRQNGAQVVEWYYPTEPHARSARADLASGAIETGENKMNWQKTFVISYKAHGALDFDKDKDELYWNLFTDYEVPVAGVSWQVILPNGLAQKPQAIVYTENGKSYKVQIIKTPNSYKVKGEIQDKLQPRSKVTIAVGWQKGLVDRIGPLASKLPFYVMAVMAVIFFVGGAAYAAYFWVTREFLPSRGTIIPEYDPPLNMTPAEMRAIYDEHAFSRKIIPATIVAMATRKDARIEEKRFLSTKSLRSTLRPCLPLRFQFS